VDERKYLAEELAEEYGKGYVSIVATAAGIEYRSKSLTRSAQKTSATRVGAMRYAAALALVAEGRVKFDWNAEALVRQHTKRFREAIEKDVAEGRPV
jgi:hypothetical protein